MFPVRGWAVSADNLKPEVAKEPSGSAAKSAGKKRKRDTSQQEVTAENFVEVWQRVIEKKEPGPTLAKGTETEGQESRKAKKRQRERDRKARDVHESGEAQRGKGRKQRSEDEGHRPGPELATSEERKPDTDPAREAVARDEITSSGAQKSSKKQKKQSKMDKKATRTGEADLGPNAEQTATATAPSKPLTAQENATATAPTSKLTPLQASMRAKLISARFRHLNETLYTKPSEEALRLFQKDPVMFEDYHAGFRNQVSVWPENPVSGYIADLLARARVRFDSKTPGDAGRKPSTPSTSSSSHPADGVGAPAPPLPRTRGTCTIADLGCGEGQLASALQPHLHPHNLKVLSYDLHSPNALVTRADMASLPLADGSVDVALFCLALMGTNWLEFVEEAYRVLRWKGELWVAEIKSRFAGAAAGAGAGAAKGAKGGGARNGPVAHSVGARHKVASRPAKNKDGAGGDDAEILATEVDGADRRQKTDVMPFVEALRKRGFVLVGEGGGPGGIDESNKMFVKMTFLKAAPATRGKMANTTRAAESRSDGRLKNRFNPEEDPEEEARRERGILKPCVYKLR